MKAVTKNELTALVEITCTSWSIFVGLEKFLLTEKIGGDEEFSIQFMLKDRRETPEVPPRPGDNGPVIIGKSWVMSGMQLGLGDYELTTAKKRTKGEEFLAEMDAVVPWSAMIALIQPRYPKTGSKDGRPPYPLAGQPD